MIGLNISAGLNSVITIYILIPFILIPQLLLSGVVVDFDRLNKVFRHSEYVPLIGDVMPSRWSYEALAVNQFKNNKYEKMFFAVEKKKKNASYELLYLIPELQGKVYETIRNIELNQEQEQSSQNLVLLSNEFKSAQKFYFWPPFGQLDKLSIHSFDSAVSSYTLNYLANVKNHVQKEEIEAGRQLDKIYNDIFQIPGGKDNLIKLRLDYFNDKLAGQVTNKQRLHKIIELDNHLIRKIDPIYMDPKSRYGRAHHYAPVKKLGNLTIDTYWFNIMVLWIGSLIMYLALVFDILRKFINWLEGLRFGKVLRI